MKEHNMRYDFSQEYANEMLEKADLTNDKLTSQLIQAQNRITILESAGRELLDEVRSFCGTISNMTTDQFSRGDDKWYIESLLKYVRDFDSVIDSRP